VIAPQIEFGSLVAELHSSAAGSRRPLNGTFELTERCNLSCRMCYVRHPAQDACRRTCELSPTAWLELAREAVDHGMVFLLLTGGEVFLRPDFFEIYTPLTRMGLLITLFTNSTLITRDIAARLAEAPPNRTAVTLYGATAATYEAVTGVPGSFSRCCDGIEALAQHGLPLSVKTTLTRQNVGELEAMREMAHAWGLPFSPSWLLSRRRDGFASEVEACRLPVATCMALEMEAKAASMAERADVTPEGGRCESEGAFYCYAGKAAFAIGADGAMNPCLDFVRPGARPLETGFGTAWTEVQRFVDAVPPASETCQRCDLRQYCPRCPAWSEMETGTLDQPVPFLCEIARARSEA
jgi:radical SAM protein with 4Fe4S-binding SPASM domain